MGYLIGWAVYGVAAFTITWLVYRYLESLMRYDAGLLLRAVTLAVLFTPWFAKGEQGPYIVPAVISVLFNILSRDYMDAVKACVPMAFVAFLISVFFLFWYRHDNDANASS